MSLDGVKLSIKTSVETPDHSYTAILSVNIDGNLFEVEDKRKNIFNTLITHRINGEVIYMLVNNRVYTEKSNIPVSLKKSMDQLVAVYLNVTNNLSNLLTHAMLYTDPYLKSNISKLHLNIIEQQVTLY